MSKTRDLANLADLNFDSGTMVVDKVNDRVGVGTSSPSEDLHIKSQTSAHADVIIEAFTGYNSGLNFHDNAGMAGRIVYNHSNNFMEFDTNGTEAARLDASGNLLVGKTSATGSSSAGHEFRSDGLLISAKNGVSGAFGRITTDGDIVQFAKDGTTVGSIGSRINDTGSGSSYIFAGGGNTCLFYDDVNNYIRPANATGGVRDNTVQLGNASNRFTNLYLSGGVYLGGTGSANKLDDYEEGSWTPTCSQATISIQAANYTKVGRLVHIQYYVSVSNATATAMTIGGLPFTNISNGWAPAVLNNGGTSANVKMGRVYAGGSYIEIKDGTDSAVLANSVGAFILQQLTYLTNA